MKILKNEDGIALALVLVLSAVLLAIMASLIFMVTSRTQISGMQRRYYTASEAAKGGLDLTFLSIGAAVGQNPTVSSANLTSLFNTLPLSITPVTQTPAGCKGTTTLGQYAGTALTGIAAKLNTSSLKADGTSNWTGCDTSITTINCTDDASTTYDLRFNFPDPINNPPKYNYRVCAKIIDTVEGLVGPDTGLATGGVATGSGAQAGQHFLYTMEVDAENLMNSAERAKFSVLYLY